MHIHLHLQDPMHLHHTLAVRPHILLTPCNYISKAHLYLWITWNLLTENILTNNILWLIIFLDRRSINSHGLESQSLYEIPARKAFGIIVAQERWSNSVVRKENWIYCFWSKIFQAVLCDDTFSCILPAAVLEINELCVLGPFRIQS